MAEDRNAKGTDPLPPREATARIRQIASGDLEVFLIEHFTLRLEERGLAMGDALHICQHGFVHKPAEPATRKGFYKYAVESTSPNSGSRTVRVVVIPGPNEALKFVTIMWADEA
jgi:hypothetical protein